MWDEINGLDKEMKHCPVDYKETFNLKDAYLKLSCFVWQVEIIITIIRMVGSLYIIWGMCHLYGEVVLL